MFNVKNIFFILLVITFSSVRRLYSKDANGHLICYDQLAKGEIECKSPVPEINAYHYDACISWIITYPQNLAIKYGGCTGTFYKTCDELKAQIYSLPVLYPITSFSCETPRNQCSKLVSFTGNNIIGTARVFITFLPYLSGISTLAESCKAKIYITSSFRSMDKPVSGAVVNPADNSNHHAGYAIDYNMGPSSSNTIECLSGCMGSTNPPSYVKCFTSGLAGLGLRDGKSISPTDPIHFDYPINLNNPKLYESIRKSIRDC